MTPEDIIAIYCLCEEYIKLKNIDQASWPNIKMNNAEIMTTFIVATRYFYGNVENARRMLKTHGYIPSMLSKRQLNRRIHALCDDTWKGIITYAWEKYGELYLSKEFIVDSFPIRVCHNIRIKRCKIFQNEMYRGYNASKKEYFYGLKASVITNLDGQPVKMFLSPGSEHDLPSFKSMDPFSLPKGSTIYGDSAYIDYKYEEKLEKRGRKLVAERKSNSLKPLELEDWTNLKAHRKKIETAFSKITSYISRKIHAVTSRGFELKIINFIISESTNFNFSYS